MSSNQKNDPGTPGKEKLPPAGVGNASNPSPQEESFETNTGNNQLLDEQAEKYLREGGNIEDMPDEQDWQKADETIEKTNHDQ